MTAPVDLPALVEALDAALREYDDLAFDEEIPHRRGKPATPAQLAKLERRLGAPLPPSYRAFLELHNGWSDFSGESKILSTQDQGSEWVEERLDDIGELCDEEGAENWFEHGALPVLLGEDTEDVLLVDPRTRRDDGEMDFVALDIIEEERRFRTFTAFLQHKLELLRRLIDKQRLGEPDQPA